jgi:molecular chaperone GrpE (heat shock protein)
MNEFDLNWKSTLKHHCLTAISRLPDDVGQDDASNCISEPPALYEFYEELLAMRNEVRKVNRKTADTFARFGDVLEAMRSDSGKLRGHLLKESDAAKKKSGVSRNMALSMVDLLDRIQRLENATRKHSQKGWRGAFKAREYGEQQSGALSILEDHLKKLLAEIKVKPITARLGDKFDPLCMKAIGQAERGADNDNQDAQLLVTEECLPGYRMGEHCLRPVEVRLTRKKPVT